ncbi:MAG: hypothetical protein Ct9H300mP25_11530 [Acidobacteriota bacterium]|nr:MAG: hypothetical protein Ct9H300mP25_11530 [Acidobacteriota bacterium]
MNTGEPNDRANPWRPCRTNDVWVEVGLWFAELVCDYNRLVGAGSD